MDEQEGPPPLRREMAVSRMRWKRRPSEGPLCGVCAGLAKHVGWKPNSLRLALIASTLLLGGFPVLLYLIAARAVSADDSG